MEELLDMIVADESPSQISGKIKDMLFSKSPEKVHAFRPVLSADTFGQEEIDMEDEEYIEDEE